MKIIPLFLALSHLFFASPAVAQHATRPDFPNSKRGGVKCEHFTKEGWDAENMTRMIRQLQPGIVMKNRRQTASEIALSIPTAGVIKGDLVVALTMDDSLDSLPSIRSGNFASPFSADSTTYGKVVSRHAKVKANSTSEWMPADGGAAMVAGDDAASFTVHTDAEATPYVEIDLGKPTNPTGIVIRNTDNVPARMATLRASVSLDGTTWSEIWKADKGEKSWEVPITSFVSSVDVPGRQLRYVRLHTKPEKPTHLLLKQIEGYAKE